jgi:hypothetical protein
MRAARHLLDEIQSIARIEALEREPGGYAARLAGELGGGATLAELAARDAMLRDALAQLDAMIERVARIRLDHALALDPSIAGPTRKVFAATVVGYAGRLELLAARARDVAARGGAPDPDRVAAVVGDQAGAALALRAAVRAGVLALASEAAAAAAPAADRHARDRTLDAATRRRWSAMRRELEATIAAPDRLASAALATRLAAWREQLDEPDAEREPGLADMIELD